MKSLAIIGTGIAGMGAFYVLKDRFDITFYEKNDYPGGHTNTVTIDEEGKPIFIDSGFMVYNEITYPNLTRLFKELGVETKPTDMSFSVQHVPSGLDFCGTGFNGLFAQRKNLCSFSFWKLLLEINRFNQEALDVLDDERYLPYTLESYAKDKDYSEDFLDKFLIPMSSGVWSTSQSLMRAFPITTLVRFFKNHGFLGLHGHYQWRTVVEGSHRYREKILGAHQDKVLLNRAATAVLRGQGKAQVFDASGACKIYDQVILACHADEALKILKDASPLEQDLLKPFTYQTNRAVLHTDTSLMPKTKRAWSSWNYRITQDPEGKPMASTIYHMNSLQHVSQKKDYFISINDTGDIHPDQVLWEKYYDHPIFTIDAIKAQAQLPQLNTNGIVYFGGAYFKYGFHEDGFVSGLEAARALTGEALWN